MVPRLLAQETGSMTKSSLRSLTAFVCLTGASFGAHAAFAQAPAAPPPAATPPDATAPPAVAPPAATPPVAGTPGAPATVAPPFARRGPIVLPLPPDIPKDYQIGPDSVPHDGVPQGRIEGPFLFRSTVFANTVHKYWIYVPQQYSSRKAASVLVFQDGQRAINPNGVLRVPVVLDNLIAQKEIPVTIGIFITPGQRGDVYPDSIGLGNPDNRSVEYDSLGDAYARFICDEMLPEVGKKYNLSKDPDQRAIGGASSGAIVAFTVAWERPNEFHKVISLIGSFTNIRGGDAYPGIVRQSDPKPIKIFIQDGFEDNRNPDNPARDWHLQNENMVAALKEKGYDLSYVFGDGPHADNHGGAILPDILRWLWRDEKK
jgi:enterochelin esterase family protein